MKDTFLFKFIVSFLSPFLFFGALIFVVLTFYSVAVWDFSDFKTVINFLNPAKHMWIRIVMEIWAVVSFLVVINFDQEINFFK